MVVTTVSTGKVQTKCSWQAYDISEYDKKVMMRTTTIFLHSFILVQHIPYIITISSNA